MNKLLDTAVAVRFLYQLVTPFNQTAAFKLGIIDERGERLRRPTTLKERDAYNKLHVLVFNLKKLIEKVPGGKSKIASYAAAAWLLKEEGDTLVSHTLEQQFYDALELFDEEAAANAAGGGAIAAIGVGPDGEPGVDKKKKKKYKKANQLDNTNLLTRQPVQV